MNEITKGRSILRELKTKKKKTTEKAHVYNKKLEVLLAGLFFATRLLCPWDSPGKNAGVCYYALLQGIFLTSRLNLSLSHLLHWQGISLLLMPSGKS